MILVTLPLRTVSEANAHTHWRVRQKRAKAQRGATGLVVGAELRASVFQPCYHPLLSRANKLRDPAEWIRRYVEQGLVVTITRIAPRALDSDNLAGSAKHLRDGVADALGVDDRDSRVTWAYAQRKGKPKAYGVEIRIEPRAAGATIQQFVNVLKTYAANVHHTINKETDMVKTTKKPVKKSNIQRITTKNKTSSRIGKKTARKGKTG